MKKCDIKYIWILIVILFTSCSDEFNDKVTATKFDGHEQNNDVIILQPRNPNLPTVKPYEQRGKDRRISISSLSENSGALLGHAYKVKDGSFIFGDYSNVSYAVLNLDAIKESDDALVNGVELNTTETSSFAYDNFIRYQQNSTVIKKIKAGFSINTKWFSIGLKRRNTKIFKTVVDQQGEAVYGELDINYVDSKFELQNSEANRRLFARQFLTRSFIRSLYNSPIASTLSSYGDFILTGYLTGGKAYAYFYADVISNQESTLKIDHLVTSMNASVDIKEQDKDTLGLKIKSGSYFKDSTVYNNSPLKIQHIG